MKDEEDQRISNQIIEAKKKNDEMMRKREEKRASLKREMDHFSDIYWQKKQRDEKEAKSKNKHYQNFWVNYNQQLKKQEDE